MAIVSLQNISISFGGSPLLDSVSLHIESGERACLVGRNGVGKSTLLKIIAGITEPDAGEVLTAPGIKIAYLPQDVPTDIRGTVRAVVEGGLHHHHEFDDWEHAHTAEQAISRLNLSPDTPFEQLSGGLKRRALLARALACNPDILLLDEPTNHLDINSIEWLENFLKRQVKTFLFVTHDRAFMRNTATKIIDLDRGQLAGWNCDYDTFLRRKQELLEEEEAIWEKKGKQLTKEEIWIRKGIKARRTRDEGRVRALMRLRREFRERRQTEGLSRIQLQQAEASGSRVIKAVNVAFTYPGEEKPVIRDFDTQILRGERVGIIGPNGSGKTTLLKLICGELKPTRGTIKLGTKLQIAYFDQLRATLDEQKSIAENIANGNDMVDVGNRRRHVLGYLQDFLFTPERARCPVYVLSGGERNRLLIAKLFLQPCNLLIMDEPTNDLDTATLELLEEQIQQHAATLLLVSHDRAFLNNVVTSTLVIGNDGTVKQYAGGYDDYLRQRPAPQSGPTPPDRKSTPKTKRPRDRKLSYREKRELDELPHRIESLEQTQAELLQKQNDPAFYRQPPEIISDAAQQLKAITTELDALLERWEELETLAER